MLSTSKLSLSHDVLQSTYLNCLSSAKINSNISFVKETLPSIHRICFSVHSDILYASYMENIRAFMPFLLWKSTGDQFYWRKVRKYAEMRRFQTTKQEARKTLIARAPVSWKIKVQQVQKMTNKTVWPYNRYEKSHGIQEKPSFTSLGLCRVTKFPAHCRDAKTQDPFLEVSRRTHLNFGPTVLWISHRSTTENSQTDITLKSWRIDYRCRYKATGSMHWVLY